MGQAERESLLGLKIEDVKRAVLCLPLDRRVAKGNRVRGPSLNRSHVSSQHNLVAFEEAEVEVIDFTDPRRALNDGVQYWLYVSRGLADDLQDVVGGGLLFEGFRLFP